MAFKLKPLRFAKKKTENLLRPKEIAKIIFPDWELTEEQWEWVEEAWNSPNEIVQFLGARGYGKTDVVTILGEVLQIYYDRKYKSIIATREFTRSKDIIKTIGEALQNLGVKGTYTKTQIRTKENKGDKQPSLRAMSSSSATKGHHVNSIVMDDIVEPKDEYSDKNKKHSKKFFDEAKSLRINGKPFKMILVGQYVAEDDLYSELEEREGVKHMRAWHGTIPLLDSNKEEYLKTSSIREWGKNYEGKFYLNEEALFTILEDQYFNESDTKIENSIAFLDPSYSSTGDYTALAVAIWRNGRVYARGYLFRHIEKLYANLNQIIKYHRIKKIFYDFSLDKGLSFKKRVETNEIKIFPFQEWENKEKKISKNLGYAFGERKLFLSRDTDSSFIKQILTYTGRDSRHDDALDVLACLVRFLKKERKIF